LVDFTVGDLRLMIGQQIGLMVLVHIAVDRFLENPYIASDLNSGDLLVSVLRVEQSWWNSCKPWSQRQLNHVIKAVKDYMQKFGALIAKFRSKE
jgi:hypothetical protein